VADKIELEVRFDDKSDNYIRRIETMRTPILDSCSETFIAMVRRGVPIKTGELWNSIEELSRGHNSVTVGTRLWRAKFIEFGVKRHPIAPKPARLATGKHVAIVWPGAIHPVAAAQHPGLIEHPFMRLAKERFRLVLPRIVKTLVFDALRGPGFV
jgi:hypothetical protein